MASHSEFTLFAQYYKQQTGIHFAVVDIKRLDQSDGDCSICREPFDTANRTPVLHTLYPSQGPSSQYESSDLEEQRQPGVGLDIPIRLTCGHVFGYDCIRGWFSKSPTCPLCREDVRLCRSPLHSAHPELRLLAWCRGRESMIRFLSEEYRTNASHSAPAIELAERAQAFIERETTMDEYPGRAMEIICHRMAEDPKALVNGEIQRINVEGLGVPREELRHLARVVSLELIFCGGIGWVHGYQRRHGFGRINEFSWLRDYSVHDTEVPSLVGAQATYRSPRILRRVPMSNGSRIPLSEQKARGDTAS